VREEWSLECGWRGQKPGHPVLQLINPQS